MPYEYITKHSSPAFTKAADVKRVFGRDRKIESLTIHHWGVDGQTFEGPISWFCRPDANTSAHYVVEAGRVACIVDVKDAAWHAGNARGNATSIGIELRPEARDGDYATAAELIAKLRDTYGDLPLIPHRDWKATECPGRWDLDRLDRLARATPTPDPAPSGGNMSNIRYTLVPGLAMNSGEPGVTGLKPAGHVQLGTRLEFTGKTYTDSKGTLWAQVQTPWSKPRGIYFWCAANYIGETDPTKQAQAQAARNIGTASLSKVDRDQAEVHKWLAPLLGTFVDWDKMYGPQCKDLVSAWIDEQDTDYTTGDGLFIAGNLSKRRGWPAIDPTPENLRPGDVVSEDTGTRFGHTWIYLGDGRMADQNGGPLAAGKGPDERVKIRSIQGRKIHAIARPPRYAQEA